MIPVVYVAVELMIGRFPGGDERHAERLAGDYSLFCHFIPQLEWPFNICGAQAAYEMVLKGLDGTCCCVETVIGRFHKLPVALFCFE